jgi:3-oxoacyl-[acyl-carrier-protein] synthase I
MSRDVHVMAVQARTALGLCAASSSAAVRAGISRGGDHPFMVDQTGDPLRCCVDGSLDPYLQGAARMDALLRDVLQRLLETLDRGTIKSVLLWVVLPEPRPGWTKEDGRTLVRELARRPAFGGVDFRLAKPGHAGGIDALQQAREAIRQGEVEVAGVAGVDSYLDAETIDWLQTDRRILNRETRASFIPGEGAGAVLVASSSVLRMLGRPSLTHIRGCGSAFELTAADPVAESLGTGLSAAVFQAATDAALGGVELTDIFCDLNGERAKTEDWGFTVLRHPICEDPSRFVAPADLWGDLGAATGPTLVALTCAAWMRAWAHGPVSLCFASSDAGLRSAVVLEAPSKRARG